MDTSDGSKAPPPGAAPVDPATDQGQGNQAGLQGEGKRLRPKLITNLDTNYICKNRNSAENLPEMVGNPKLVEYPDSSSPDTRTYDSDSRISYFDSPGFIRNADQNSQGRASDQDSDGDIQMVPKSGEQNPKPIPSGSASDSVDSKSGGQEPKSISSGLASDSGYKTLETPKTPLKNSRNPID